jgi:hypothetical protein
VETQRGRKPQNDFSYMSLRITFIVSIKFLFFQDATGRRLQNPSFLGYNLRETPTPQFSSYNQKEDTTPYVFHLQPLVLSLSNFPNVEVELWNHCHTITVRYATVKMYRTTALQSTCT